jgi:succinate dehydrogenase / fumarate reductase flavoprotein subunit
MGGLWADYAKGAGGGLDPANPRNHQTDIPGLYAIGECDYQYHGANRLGANSLLSCIFSGLFVAPGIQAMLGSLKGSAGDERFDGLHRGAVAAEQARHDALLKSASNGAGENPYQLHQALGDEMTRAALVVRKNDQIREGIARVNELAERAQRCTLSDTGAWTNQNVVFTKALRDMFPLAKALLIGALQRDECRGAHYKPDFEMPGIAATDPSERRREAEAWCDSFEEKNRRWLKSSVATVDASGQVTVGYEGVDTSLIPPRPRLYGLVGAEVIEEAWKDRQKAKDQAANLQPAMA